MLDDKVMSNWLVKASDAAKSTWNVVRSIGPLLISQSDAASEAYARHQMRLASVEAGKELLLAEVLVLTDVKKELLQQYVAADSTERLRIKRDMEEVAASLRQLKVGAQALSYIATNDNKTDDPASPVGDSSAQSDVTQHWIDKFSELARTNNEPWREDLLARALAAESAQPGTVSTKALWLLGTMEEHHFVAFATILDLCSVIGGGLIVPLHNKFNLRPIPGCQLGPQIGLGHLIYRLQDVDLLADTLTTSKTIPKGSRLFASYGSNSVLIECTTQDLRIHGIIPTAVGMSVASFCDRKFNPLGKEIFDAWLTSLDKTAFPQTIVAQQ